MDIIVDDEWAEGYIAALPTSPHKPGDTATFWSSGSCTTGWRQVPMKIVVSEGEIVNGMVVRGED